MMVGKVAFITGATSGMGEATAYALSAQGATVVLHGRDRKKARKLAEEIGERTKNPAVYFLVADLGRLGDVRDLASDFRREFHRLDVLVNNAGAVFGRREESEDGFELTLQVNYLSHFLLTHLLLDVLKDGAPARVINVTSSIHERGRIDFEDLQMTKKYSGQKAYASSKLAMVLFTYELARRLEGSDVTCNASNPGIAKTDLGYDAGLIASLSRRVVDLFGKSAEKGADNTIFLATSDRLNGVTGKYFEDCQECESSEMSYDEGSARKLWSASMRMVGLAEDDGG